MLEKSLIEHCSPTLAGLKTANMFNYRFSSVDILQQELKNIRQKLDTKGVYLEILRMNRSCALLYVYRKKRLEEDLRRNGVEELLLQHGYSDNGLEECLEELKRRLSSSREFPHEIGLFLGYPLEDIVGFIEQKGKNYKYCGVWKVYSNELETQKLFAKFQKCKEVYIRVFEKGRNLAQMTVAA